ncbi:hypothetical protein HYT23_02250 [Candidatus Pacearchaeota archaeon]|nr:hypothetical protein [Candidatus Pacearchaeota archaeon]
MTQYLIRTNKDEEKTYILRVGTPAEIAGMIYTDFNINLGDRDISTEDVVNPLSNKSIARVELYRNGNIVAVELKRKELSAYTLNGEYKEGGIVVPYRRMTKDFLASRQEYKTLGEMGLTHAYFLGDESSLSQVFCFEKEADISGLVNSREADDISALKGLALVLAQRIEDQEFVFEFMRK